MLYLLAILVHCAIVGVLSKELAARKGYDGYFWLGFFLGTLGLIYVAGLPQVQQDEEPTPKWLGEVPEHRPADAAPRAPGPAAPAQSVYAAETGDGNVRCPACGRVQRADRRVCYSCGARFEQKAEGDADGGGQA